MLHTPKPELSIIIVNYNTKLLIYNCIVSIKEKTKDLTYEIIVVDNKSKDDSVAFLRQNFPDIIILESQENIGFGRANNLGANIAKADIFFLLNSDTIIIDNSIKILYDYMKFHPGTGVCGGFLLNADGSLGHSAAHQLSLKRDLYTFLMWKKNIQVETHITKVTDVGYICGADMMIRKDAFENAGKFDPDFFLYYEESELSYRIKKKNYRIQLIPSAKIIHLAGQSGTEKKELSAFILAEKWYSRFLYFRKVYNERQPYYLYLLYSLQCFIGITLFSFIPHKKVIWKNRLHHMQKGFLKYKNYCKQIT